LATNEIWGTWENNEEAELDHPGNYLASIFVNILVNFNSCPSLEIKKNKNGAVLSSYNFRF